MSQDAKWLALDPFLFGILSCDFGILNWDLDSLWGSAIRTWRGGRQIFALGKAGDGENNLSSIALGKAGDGENNLSSIALGKVADCGRRGKKHRK